MFTGADLAAPSHFSDRPLPQSDDYICRQMQLFQDFNAPDNATRMRLSNSLDFWDAIPKYSTNRLGGVRSLGRGAVPAILTRTFVFGNTHYTLEIRPARIRYPHSDAITDCYPSSREEIVEDALRKIASQQHSGFYTQVRERPRSGVRFSLLSLHTYLRTRGHTFSRQELKEALLILADCRIAVIAIEDRTHKQMNASILSALVLATPLDNEQHPHCTCYAEFHPLITEAIGALQYRQFDLASVLQHRKPLARWLHKYLIRTALNASTQQRLKLRLQEVKTASGLLGAARWRDDLRSLRAALEELVQNQVLTNLREVAKDPAGQPQDQLFMLTPSRGLVDDIIAANRRRKAMHQAPLANPERKPPRSSARPALLPKGPQPGDLFLPRVPGTPPAGAGVARY